MNDVWARNNGPIFVVNEKCELAITNWEFNGWGQRFEYKLDNQVPARIGEKIAVPVFNAPLVLEGGSLSLNGAGTLLATRTSIIDSHRNPGMSQNEIENTLSQYLGPTHFIWLTGAGRGECEKSGDATDSHIDIVARFTDKSTVIYNWLDDESDPRYGYGMFIKSLAELEAATRKRAKRSHSYVCLYQQMASTPFLPQAPG